jgi:DNA polymerase III delta prime subunit
MSDFDDSLLEEAEQFDEMYREFNQEEGLWGGVEEDFYEEAEQGENDHIQKEESSRVAPLAPPAAGDLAPYTASHEKVHGWQKDYMQCDDDDDDDDDNGVNMGYDRRQLIAKLAARSREKRNFSALGSVAVMSEVKMATFCGHLKRNKGPNDDQAGVFERTASSAPSFPPEALLLPPEDSECVTWTLKSGRRLFFRKITREYKGPGRTAFSLLDKPFSDVERQADELAIRKVRETERQILSHPLAGNPHQQNDLWVDKYSPKAFPSLLSDERINRGVLRALKEWDPFVFGKKLPAAESGKGLQCKSSSLKMYMGAKGGAGTGTDPASTDSSRDPNDLRPECKVIMLCGPPGLGKTTLAHIVAQQAGYRPLEINASDDRSAPVLRQRVTLAMESRSLFGERRPNCIILDEVDGADGMLAINALVSICNAPLRHKAGKAGKGKGRRGTDPPLTRPLILICNNQYAPALRPIRSIARIFTFRHTAPQRLVSRLQAVCHCEKITVRPEALKKLCDKSGTDIRSCLNALQSLSLQLGSSSRKVDATAAVLSEVSWIQCSRARFPRQRSGTQQSVCGIVPMTVEITDVLWMASMRIC